ncbi:MAG: histidine phosphatase family protein [Ilumatobacter sp.]|uniref:histidine phosphatase family protein n=1 Tax=Ilumatobacter sp. TaxID=1967498 RepID=UPI00262259D1|nr:histidine phosphatase family protein [Ilumatobacter sp.]MDJ0769562.1 histidine phosphatase family protein [Ilumatobacter sp.]
MSAPREFRQPRFVPPDGACEILLVRHGESAPLIEGGTFPLVGGHSDPPLAPEGEEQAELVADRLIATGERIAAIYVTTLTRTHQTAAPLARRLGLEPIVEADLREVFLGDWEGGEFRHRVADEDPIAVEMFATGRWDVIPNGEPTADFEARVRAGIERIAAAHADELVVAVVHGGVIGQVMNIIADTSGFRFGGADNASISHIVIEEDRWRLRCFNDTSHLGPTFSTAPQPMT